MRSDCASIPTRGSRLVGLLSIIITSVLGSGACEQERRGSTTPAVTSSRIVILVVVYRERAQSRSFASLRMTILSCAGLLAKVFLALPPHAYEIFPRIAARFAPVADGTLLGLRCHVSCASRAKATASFASAGRPNSSEKCSPIPKGAISSRNMAISVGFFAPPPETIISCSRRRCDPNRGTTNRRTASAIDRAVNAVAVATTSGLLAPWQSLKKMAHVFPAEFLATRRPRRLLPEKVRAQQLRDHAIQYASRGRDFAIAIIAPCE